MINLANGEYQDFFKAKLEDYGVKSPSEMDEATTKKFFDEVKSEWKNSCDPLEDEDNGAYPDFNMGGACPKCGNAYNECECE